MRAVVLALLFASLVVAGGCSSRDDAPQERGAARAGARDPGPAIIAASATPYREVSVASPGTIVGTVVADGDLPRDSTIQVPAAQALCGATVPDASLVHRGAALANVVVWVAGVRSGKALPVDRRFEITTQHCEYDPHVQAVVVGSAVNVHNDDDAAETTRMISRWGDDTLATVTLIDDGGVVPSDRIARTPGMVELHSSQRQWSLGYVAVFDHPYFAVTGANGAFRVDSLPPGRYRLMAWHERGIEPVAQDVDVPASGQAKVELKLRVK